MISDSKVRVACPSVSFFFARLGAALGVSGDFLPLVGDFVFEGNCLGDALAELLPLLRQSIDWFEGLVREQGMMFEVRSSELRYWVII